ncbi:MAG: sulfatase-like hydrolase/transferase, partial [Verrucomicrobia bacterium]|nr:sulfatase-like hydrolase/transferase [Verrucomicrobiota bacterium]
MSPKPNILIFMTDQQRACSVLPGDPYKAITPVLDEFRKDAVTFSRAFCPSPHSCPSRASFMTGLMPTQHGVWHNVNVTNAITRGMKEHVRPWSVDMKQAGYQMRLTGKWHVSNYQQPEDYGWNDGPKERDIPSLDEQEAIARRREVERIRERAVGSSGRERGPGEILRNGYTPYVHYGTKENPTLAQHFRGDGDENPFNDRGVVESALEMFDDLDQNDPWCMYVGTLGPHDPYIAPQRFLDLYDGMDFDLPDTFDDPMEDKPALYRRTRDRFNQLTREEHKEAIKHYLAFCSYEDWLFGLLVDKLKELGEYENTVILYVSDHGDYLGDHGLWCKGLPAFLSNYHVPAILKMPGGGQGTDRDELVSLCDFGPTFLEMAGIDSPVEFAGQSLVPLLTSDSSSEAPFWQKGATCSPRSPSARPLTGMAPSGRREPSPWPAATKRSEDGRDALFFQTNGNETYGIQRSIVTDKWRFVFNAFDYDELYDLENDPGQVRNLAPDPAYEAVKQEMYTRIWEFGLAHDEHLNNDYIMTAMADYGPGVAVHRAGE